MEAPVKDIQSAIPVAVNNMQAQSVLPAAKGIMTTDTFPKVRSQTLNGGGRIVGIAKGAGMVEPNMATMLAYILTDIAVPKVDLQATLSCTVNDTFNCISIDSDQSTSDTVIAMSSGIVPLSGDDHLGEFKEKLGEITAALAEDIVRNGEGVWHVIKVTVKGHRVPFLRARSVSRW